MPSDQKADKPRILVVEDDPIVSSFIGLKLVELGYEPVGWTTTGEQAITLAGELKPDLVLMDVMLAGAIDGIAAARTIHEQFGLPVVFLTAFSDDEIIERAKLAGPLGYIIKPFTDRELRVGMEMALFTHRADARLRESEDRYRALVDWSPDAFAIHRQGKIVEVNPAAVKMFGARSAEDLVGRDILEFIHPDFHQRVRNQLATSFHAEGGPPVAEMKFLRLDGAVIDVEAMGVLFPYQGQTAIYSTIRDISARLRAQKRQSALFKISEAAMTTPDVQALFRSVHGIISELMPARNFYVALHDRFTDLMTFPYFIDEFDPTPAPRKHQGRHGLTDRVLDSGEPLLISPDNRESTFALPDVELIGTSGFDWLGVPLKTEQGVIGVLVVQPYSGDVRYAETDKELLQFVSGQVAFAVERKQSQQTVRENERLFRSLFDQSPSIISLVAMPEGRLQEMNPAGLETLGFSREEITSATAEELKLWVDAAERKRYLDLVQAHGVVRDFEAKVRRRNGDVLTLLHNGSLVQLGEKAYVLNSVEDITERKLAQDSLQSSLREKEALLREVHHRVKNNLQVITSLLRLEMGRDQNAAARPVLSDMQGRIQSMAMLHESLYRTGVFAGVDLGAYLGQLAGQSFRASSRRSGAVRLHLDLASVPIDMDQAMPCGLLLNELVSNCLKHGFPGDGTGEVRIELQLLGGGPRLRLRVSDTGVGLPEDFDIRREDSLGLQLIDDLVAQLGGTLEIGPRPAAMFTIEFTPNATVSAITASNVTSETGP